MKKIWLALWLALPLLLLCACEESHTHTYASRVVPPSCTEGYTLYTCDCGHSYTDQYVAALGHSYESALEDSACNELRPLRHTCSVCGYSYTETSEEYGTLHDMKMVHVVTPGRTEGGYTLYRCAHCGTEEQRDHTEPTDYSVGLEYKKTNGYPASYYVAGIGSCRDSRIVLPEVNEKGQKVVGIYAGAFSEGCEKIVSITVPASYTEIGKEAFCGCSGLVELTAPLLRPLGEYFDSSIPAEMPLGLTTVNVVGRALSHATLSECATLTRVTLSEEIIDIPDLFFSDCTSLGYIQYSENVKTLGKGAFLGTSITSFVLPKNVTVIPERLLAGCRSLTSVTLHDGLTGIGAYAFLRCNQLGSVTLPPSLRTVGEGAFTQCSSLRSIAVPASVTSIPDFFVSYCSNLSEVTLHDSIVSIGHNAFQATALTSFTYPSKLKGYSSFLSDCKKLTSVDFNGYVGVIDGFQKCTSLKTFTVPEGVTEIATYAFSGCTALEEIVLPSTLRQIGYYAFENCKQLKSVSIPTGISLIDRNTFSGCSALKTVVLPETVTEIGIEAFRDCVALSEIDLHKNLTVLGGGAFSGSGLTSFSFPEGTLSVKECAFANCPLLETVTLSKNLKVFESAFQGCAKLKTVTVGEGVTSLGRYVFRNCTSLEQLTLPDSLTSIGAEAFRGCTALTVLTVPRSLTTVASDAFRDCGITELVYRATACASLGKFPLLEKLTVEEGVEVIPANLCYGNTTLSSVSLPASVKTISANAFYGCTALREIVLPKQLKTVGASAFEKCGLISVTFGESDFTLGSAAFKDCKALTSLDFNGKTVLLSGSVFSGCTALTELKNHENVEMTNLADFPSMFHETVGGVIYCGGNLLGFDNAEIDSNVTIPEGIRYIRSQAFKNCTVIKSVSFPSTLTVIGEYAFEGCTRLQTVVLPDGVTAMGDGVFYGCSALTDVTFPAALEVIPAKTLSLCPALTHVTFGAKVRTIGSPFYTTSYASPAYRHLYTVTYLGTKADWEKVTREEANGVLESCSIHCSDGTIVNTVHQKFEYDGTPIYKIDSDMTLTLYGDGEFSLNFAYDYYQSLFKKTKRLVLSEGITALSTTGLSVFTNVEEIVLPTSMESFPINSFSGSPWYQGLFDENGLYVDGTKLMAVSPNVSGAVTVPEGITEINGNAFFQCDLITEIHVPSTVERIGAQAFNQCDVLESVYLSEGLLELGEQAFMDCPMLKNVTLPQSLIRLGAHAFWMCHSIEEITVPKGVLLNDVVAFSCEGLKKLTILATVETDAQIVQYCHALEVLILGEGVNHLRNNAVDSCSKLSVIVIPESLTDFDRNAFYISNTVKLCFVSEKNAQAVTDALNASKGSKVFTPYLYTETSPTDGGNWWHYDEQGIPVIYE